MDRLLKLAMVGNLEGVRFAVKAGEPLDAIEPDHGNTALMLAAFHNHHHVVAALVEAGADIEAKCFEQNTALMKAAWGGGAEAVQLLVDAGAEVDADEV